MFCKHAELVKTSGERSRQTSIRYSAHQEGNQKEWMNVMAALELANIGSLAADIWVLVTRPLRKGFVQGHHR